MPRPTGTLARQGEGGLACGATLGVLLGGENDTLGAAIGVTLGIAAGIAIATYAERRPPPDER